MTPSVVLINRPTIDFEIFLTVAFKLLGHNPSSQVDQSRLQRSDAERFISCLSALRDPNAPAGLTPNLLNHVSYSALIAADERDLIDILEAASGMPFVSADTVDRRMLAVVSGDLSQWRDAVKSGATPAAEFNVRLCFCQIKASFEQAGLNLWKDFQVKPAADGTLYIEDKRR
jgi:hypothetical protein